MQIILLSGGSGKRLWPLSNEVNSKQFIKVFRDGQSYRSMLQKVLNQIRKIPEPATITISTSKAQETILKKYVGADATISPEPCRRNTFPAIALTAAYLHDVKNIPSDEPIIICPVDPYAADDFFLAFQTMADLVRQNAANLILLGIKPTYPSEKYGYIIPATNENISRVLEFKEKPNLETAQKYILGGGLWNGGVFACKLSYLREKSIEILKTNSYSEILKNYSSAPNISFDYAVSEHEGNIKVVRYNGEWKDIGTWNTLAEVMEETAVGKVQFDSACENSHFINKTDVPLIAMGLKNIVVAASPDGILVADKKHSSYIAPFVENLNEPIRYSEKSWGTYQLIDVDEYSLTIKVTLNSGSKMNYHSHNYRDEVWTIFEGRGQVILDGRKFLVGVGDVVKIPAGAKHTIIAVETLKIIEVQLGENITVEDKILWEDLI